MLSGWFEELVFSFWRALAIDPRELQPHQLFIIHFFQLPEAIYTSGNIPLLTFFFSSVSSVEHHAPTCEA
jgi:hypothetical protein